MCIKPDHLVFIWLAGKPGSGKGTQVKQLLKDPDFAPFLGKENGEVIYSFSTGDLVRAECEENPEFKKRNQKLSDRGKLIPDRDLLKLWKDHVKEKIETGSMIFISDGAPRNGNQARKIYDYVNSIAGAKLYYLNLYISEAEAIRRIYRRSADWIHMNMNLVMRKRSANETEVTKEELAEIGLRRTDDSAASVLKRLVEFDLVRNEVVPFVKEMKIPHIKMEPNDNDGEKKVYKAYFKPSLLTRISEISSMFESVNA